MMQILINGKISAEWDGTIKKCKGCGRQIGWAKTEAGKAMPFDHPDEKYTSHFGTCPIAKEFRK